MKSHSTLLLISLLLLSQSAAIEFYYNLLHGGENCFEEHLAGQTLVTGEVFFTRSGPVDFRILNPINDEVLVRVRIAR